MPAIDPNTLVTTALGGGGALFVAALVKAWRDLKNGARARDRDTVGSLREQRDEAEVRTRDAVGDRDWYLDICGRLVYQLRAAHIEPDVPDGWPIPPSQREEVPPPPATTRRRRPPRPTV